jgi:Protein of unknown function (DUF3047)
MIARTTVIGAGIALAGLTMLGVGAIFAASEAPECQVIEDFGRTKVGEFPADWKPRKDAGKTIYSVQEEAGVRFLRATARGLGIQAARQHEWDLTTYPVLAWSWRPREFPRGGDERESATNDSVLAVYMLVPYSRTTGPKAVKYIWSERVPVATHLTSNMGLTQVRVLRSGTAGKDEWKEERVNVRQDYQTAQGDYANFRICRS